MQYKIIQRKRITSRDIITPLFHSFYFRDLVRKLNKTYVLKSWASQKLRYDLTSYIITYIITYKICMY